MRLVCLASRTYPVIIRFAPCSTRCQLQQCLESFVPSITVCQRREISSPISVFKENFCASLDGTEYFSSQKIHCCHCCHRTHKNGSTTYFHAAVTPVLVAPGRPQVISKDARIHNSPRWSRQTRLRERCCQTLDCCSS